MLYFAPLLRHVRNTRIALFHGNIKRAIGVYVYSCRIAPKKMSQKLLAQPDSADNPIIEANAMKSMAGVATLGDLASAIGVRTDEAAVIAELQAGSEEAYVWLISQYHSTVYGLVYRVLSDPADAADTTQEVFLKVFRGIRSFHGQSSLKTWIYRIALHEASNRRRWWFRHKSKETSMEPENPDMEFSEGGNSGLKDTLVDRAESPFDNVVHEEIRAQVELELRNVPEPYRTALVLRDLEELSYEEIAEVTGATLGTVKSRLTRGREALRQRLTAYIERTGAGMGLTASKPPAKARHSAAEAEKVQVTR
jgi:RNA polymerase sigma-70 factor, ECF subfamily